VILSRAEAKKKVEEENPVAIGILGVFSQCNDVVQKSVAIIYFVINTSIIRDVSKDARWFKSEARDIRAV
jgi:hypothetical protein